MMFAPLPTRSAPARPELTAGLSASSVPPSEPPSEPAGDSSTPDHDHDHLAGWPRPWLPHLEMLLDDSSTPDHDHVSEAGMIDLKTLLDDSSTPTAPYRPLPPPSHLMPPPPTECLNCSNGLLQGFAEQYWEDHLRQQADRAAGPPADDLPDPSAKTMNAETTSTDQSTDQSAPAATQIESLDSQMLYQMLDG